MGTSSKVMRIRRIQAAASPEVRAALKARQITLYRAGEIARLPADQREAALAQWADLSRCRTEGQSIAARVIRRDLRRYARVDLDRIASAIRDTLRHR
jgi:hypothetical protein